LYNVLYYYQRSTCFGRFFRPSSGAYKTVRATLGIVMLSCCLPQFYRDILNLFFFRNSGSRLTDLQLDI